MTTVKVLSRQVVNNSEQKQIHDVLNNWKCTLCNWYCVIWQTLSSIAKDLEWRYRSRSGQVSCSRMSTLYLNFMYLHSFQILLFVQERHLKTQCASNALMEHSQMATQLLVCLTQGKGTFHLIYQCSLYNCIYIIVMSSANLYSQRNVGIA